MVNLLKLNSFTINGIVAVVDVFLSKKNNSLVAICNNYNYVLKNTNIDLRKIKWRLYNNDMENEWNDFEILTMNDGCPMELNDPNTSIKSIFYNGFHNDIFVQKNFQYKNIHIELKIGDFIHTVYIADTFNMFQNDKCMTTMHKNEVHLIDSWINYHKQLGFEKFIIYDNNYQEINYTELDKKYSDCLFVIDAKFPYWLDSYGINTVGQNIQQNHTIWKYLPKFLALTDLDEYITSKIPIFSDDISILSFPNFWFGCGNKQNYTFDNFLDKLTKRQDESTANICCQRKCIIQPKDVDLFCVHIPINYTGEFKRLNYNEGYLRHYMSLNSKKRECNCEVFCKIEDSLKNYT